MVGKNLPGRSAYSWLVAGVAVNLALLAVFKYANFFIENLNALFENLELQPIPQTKIILPIGISFYTFHALSYLVDIYRGKTQAQHNILNLALYISMFSQLIAGPIIRYSDVWQQLTARVHSLQKFASGVERFLIGLAKKVLLANTFAVVADATFAMNPSTLDGMNAWLGIICYSLQIYCDFAGYSNMAIGLGKMFGFEFLENFNYPYIARSVKEFWRRWHMSLSGFFRDYVYIPLGGNRVASGRVYVNLLIVFFLTGFWHGASWSFVVWGLFHGFFMVLEKLGLEKLLLRAGRPIANVYTLIVVIFAWVLFRADSLEYALSYWKAMFRFQPSGENLSLFYHHLNIELSLALFIAVLGASGFFKWLGIYQRRILLSPSLPAQAAAYGLHTASAVFYCLVIFLCTLSLVGGSYNPFIYYRF
jgi:alginate O-acetyltransferase complex protein AlgI